MSKLLDIHFFFEFLLHFYTHYRNIILLFPVVFSIEGAVGDGFHQVLGKDIRFVGEVCDGSGNLSDTVVGTGTETEFGQRMLEQSVAGFVDETILIEHLRGHLCIAVDAGALETHLLYLPCMYHSLTDCRRGLSPFALAQL